MSENIYLSDATSAYNRGDNMAAIAAATTGLLASIMEHAEQESREEFLEAKWDECDAALGRVLDLAKELDAHPNATLKPTAFRDLAARIRAAVDGRNA